MGRTPEALFIVSLALASWPTPRRGLHVEAGAPPRPMGERVLLLHVGKAGGGTVRRFLSANRIRFKEIHLRQPRGDHIRAYNRILVTLRDPTERVISAYKWEHPDGPGRTPDFPGLKRIYECFPNATSYAEAFLPSSSVSMDCAGVAWRSIGVNVSYQSEALFCSHTCRGHAYYTEQWFDEICAKRPYALRTEQMASDLNGLGPWLGVHLRSREVLHEKDSNRRNGETVTNPAALSALRAALAHEYYVHAQLLRCSANGEAQPADNTISAGFPGS
mmetsp:Transcript_16124/g.54195  ORF Transcript_16124/g.54195 Transcript_16124/m.54195 type:complete len:275 (-) Transcript_16124:70-894(-)